MNLTPIRRDSMPSLREHALTVIRNAITAGELAEDRIYSAAGLAKQLGMSLSPVREAMMSLVTEGTVEAVPNRGFRLVPISYADLEEIVHIRSLLAVPATESLCRQAAESAPEFSARLARLQEDAESAVAATAAEDRVGFMHADRSFHEHLLEFGLGKRAAGISLRLRDQSRIFSSSGNAGKVDRDSAMELVQLVDLIAEHKPREAADLVVRNLHYFQRFDD